MYMYAIHFSILPKYTGKNVFYTGNYTLLPIKKKKYSL